MEAPVGNGTGRSPRRQWIKDAGSEKKRAMEAANLGLLLKELFFKMQFD